jgi:peptidoglycan-binding protein ArfA
VCPIPRPVRRDRPSGKTLIFAIDLLVTSLTSAAGALGCEIARVIQSWQSTSGGPMASSEEASETTEWRRAARFYRRPLGVPWLIALAIVPLLLAAIGYGLLGRNQSESNPPTGALPTPPSGVNTPTIPPVSLAPVSVIRNGDDITLSGFFPDERAKAALLDAVIASVGSNANVIDTLGINPDVTSLDFSDAGPVFSAAASITDFSLVVNGDTITLGGTAASAKQQDAVEQAAEDAWPNLNIVDKMGISGPITPTGAPSAPPTGSPPS